jgi:aminopeptidase-like protein
MSNYSMLDLINELWFLKRDIVSDGFDKALFRLAEELPMQIHEYPTDERCWTWNVPEKWTCHQAYLETLDGRRLIDYDKHPLHVVSYSLPFNGIVSREELLKHLHVHPRLPDAIPFVFKYYQRDWGLCAQKSLVDSLTDDAYRVVIRTSFEPGKLKVGEVVIPGESDESFMIVAHLCHPAQVNDDLTGVVVGLDVFRHLLARLEKEKAKLRYTYRLLIVPETIGSVAYLSHYEDLIPKMIGGLFLEMLGNDSPHALQLSFQPESQTDLCLQSVLPDLDPRAYIGPYRGIIDNDERQFNSPGVRVPMLSLSRVEAPKSSGQPPYPQYHSSLDTPSIVSQARLEASRNIVLGIIDAWEKNKYIINQFKGEIFCSGYGIWVDYRINPQGHKRLFEIMERCDGEHTLADIAQELRISFYSVREIIDQLLDNELITLSDTPKPTTPQR